jgi:hypothetical protein
MEKTFQRMVVRSFPWSRSPRTLRLLVNFKHWVLNSKYIRALFLNIFALPLHIYTSGTLIIDCIYKKYVGLSKIFRTDAIR